MTKITNTWTYNHKLLIITLSLAVAHIVPLIPVPQWVQAETVTYQAETATTTAIYTLKADIEQRAIELYNANKQTDLEQYRLKAITQLNEELQAHIYVSPFVDYDAINKQLDN